jgi:hypothetical protein
LSSFTLNVQGHWCYFVIHIIRAKIAANHNLVISLVDAVAFVLMLEVEEIFHEGMAVAADIETG